MNTSNSEAYRENILIVDDTPENVQFLSTVLAERGYKVRGVIKGKMAIRAALSVIPDLILLDIKMPEMDGYQVCEALKAEPQTKEVPIIFISALDEVLDKVKAFSLGGVDYITKPFYVEEVFARVENQLTIQKLQKQLKQQNERLQKEIKEREIAESTALAASKAKSEFVANMSHELRTPLNAILGFSQLMTRDPSLNEEQKEYLTIINRSGEHLLELIDEVLELSKIEAGITWLNETTFDIYRLLDTLEVMLQMKAETKGIDLIFIVANEVPQYVKTDEKKLRCCLINIIGNAIKFTRNGSVTLLARMVEKKEEGEKCETINPSGSANDRYLDFQIEDTGPGIAANEIEKIFDAFVQTEAGRKSSEGTGLGLTITRKFVEMMGGGITVSSVLGKGTTFKFKVKIEIAEPLSPIVKPLRRVIGLALNQINYRILIVDDTKENRQLLVKLLAPIGFEVREAENGQEALTCWEDWHPDLVFMDTRMPVMDGLQASKEIRSKESKLVNADKDEQTDKYSNASRNISSSTMPKTVIIALTASAFEEKKGEILASGADSFIRKPFKEEVIFEKIAEYLEVNYIYEELTEPTRTFATRERTDLEMDSLLLEKLALMPPSWVDNLYHAANQANDDIILHLIEQIPENNAPLAEILTNLVNDFRLDIIMILAEQVK